MFFLFWLLKSTLKVSLLKAKPKNVFALIQPENIFPVLFDTTPLVYGNYK